MYNYIDACEIPGLHNADLLEKIYRKKRSKKMVLRKDRRCPERKSIEERSDKINNREEFGLLGNRPCCRQTKRKWSSIVDIIRKKNQVSGNHETKRSNSAISDKSFK